MAQRTGALVFDERTDRYDMTIPAIMSASRKRSCPPIR